MPFPVISFIASLFDAEFNDYNLLASDAPPSRENLKILKHSKHYQVTFSLLNGNTRDGIIHWDIEKALSIYFSNFLSKINSISKFSISSQILNDASMSITPSQTSVNNKTLYYLNPESLGLFVNSDWNLASVVSTATPIEFIIYVPPRYIELIW